MTDVMETHRRSAILRYLRDAPVYTANVSVISDVVNDLGVVSSRDQIVTSVNWLAENGFVTLTRPDVSVIVVRATERGIEIATGRAVHEGIKRPRAGA